MELPATGKYGPSTSLEEQNHILSLQNTNQRLQLADLEQRCSMLQHELAIAARPAATYLSSTSIDKTMTSQSYLDITLEQSELRAEAQVRGLLGQVQSLQKDLDVSACDQSRLSAQAMRATELQERVDEQNAKIQELERGIRLLLEERAREATPPTPPPSPPPPLHIWTQTPSSWRSSEHRLLADLTKAKATVASLRSERDSIKTTCVDYVVLTLTDFCRLETTQMQLKDATLSIRTEKSRQVCLSCAALGN